MMVKICGITNREDALAAIEGGASALGFNFYPKSPRYIEPDRAAEIIAGLPAGIWKVGVFVHESEERISQVAQTTALDIAQVYKVGQAIRLPALRIWRAIPVSEARFVPDRADHPFEAVLFDTPSDEAYGGTGQPFDWSKAAGFTRLKIILAGGLDATNVRRAIAVANPWGVDVCSRIESEPGRKDHVKMAQFLKEAME